MDTCAICYADDAPEFVCRHECRVHAHVACLDAWYRHQYICPICRRSMFPRWLTKRARALRTACAVVWFALCLPVMAYWALLAPARMGLVGWLFFYADTLLVDCLHDLCVATDAVRRPPRLFRRPVQRAAANVVVSFVCYAVLNSVIRCRLAVY